MTFIKKLAIFVVVFLVLTQLTFSYAIPASLVYNQRPTYDVIKNNQYDIETTIKEIKKIIDREKLKDYVIFLGDSVGYGTPCPPENSISSCMNQIAAKEGSPLRVFNLSVPSMMFGDFFIMIKLLEEYGVSTKNLIIDFCYWDFRIKTPVFWLKHYFQDMDPENYKTMMTNVKKPNLWNTAKDEIIHKATTGIAMLEYREYVIYSMKNRLNIAFGDNVAVIKPWYTKDFLPAEMKKDENSWYYTDKPFDMDEADNPQVYFLNKIIEVQKGRNTIIFMAAMNDKLLQEGTSKPGYIENMKKIDKAFGNKAVKYVNYNKKIDYNLFSDHVHLIPAGYKALAEDLWKRINEGRV